MRHQSPVAPRDTGGCNLLHKDYWCDISPESNHHHLLHRGSVASSSGPRSVGENIMGVPLKVSCSKDRKGPVVMSLLHCTLHRPQHSLGYRCIFGASLRTRVWNPDRLLGETPHQKAEHAHSNACVWTHQPSSADLNGSQWTLA